MSEKREQYIAKLKDILTPVYLKEFKEIFKKTSEKNTIHKKVLREFQANLNNISQWLKLDIYENY